MSKLKTIISTGILVTNSAISPAPSSTNFPAPSPIVTTTTSSHTENKTKQKIYHRFEEIPAISDQDAALYNKNEYTYIINADVYQQTGKIELKRVLASEVTKANTLGLIYRGECETYTPKENEDALICYKLDMKIISPDGTFKSPSQMNDAALTAFARYLCANPNTRKYVLPLITFTPSDKLKKQLTNEMKENKIPSNQMLNYALSKLEKLCFTPEGTLLPIEQRNSIIFNDIYRSIKFNSNAWNTVASSKLKMYIQKESRKRTRGLSNETKNYLCLIEMFPSIEAMQQVHEDYNLTSYALGRQGKPKQIMYELAKSMNLKDENGNLDATRIPTFAIAASISSINWRGNGNIAKIQACSPKMRSSFRSSWKEGIKYLQQNTKFWVTGKSRTYGVNELAKLNILTPLLIEQYQKLELAGAENLKKKYQNAIMKEEAKVKPHQNLTVLLSQKSKQR